VLNDQSKPKNRKWKIKNASIFKIEILCARS